MNVCPKRYKTTQVNKKQVWLHRYIMETHLGRKLGSEEIIHHIDGDHLNNDISNLAIVSRKDHLEIHRADMPKRKSKYIVDDKLFRALYFDEMMPTTHIAKALSVTDGVVNWYIRINNLSRIVKCSRCQKPLSRAGKSSMCRECYMIKWRTDNAKK